MTTAPRGNRQFTLKQCDSCHSPADGCSLHEHLTARRLDARLRRIATISADVVHHALSLPEGRSA
jgi:hypothetical protein